METKERASWKERATRKFRIVRNWDHKKEVGGELGRTLQQSYPSSNLLETFLSSPPKYKLFFTLHAPFLYCTCYLYSPKRIPHVTSFCAYYRKRSMCVYRINSALPYNSLLITGLHFQIGGPCYSPWTGCTKQFLVSFSWPKSSLQYLNQGTFYKLEDTRKYGSMSIPMAFISTYKPSIPTKSSTSGFSLRQINQSTWPTSTITPTSMPISWHQISGFHHQGLLKVLEHPNR